MDSLSSSKRRPLAPETGRLRTVKSKVEQAVMRQAADIRARAHNKVRVLSLFYPMCHRHYCHADYAVHRAEDV